MNGKTLDTSWKAWVKENVERQCSPKGIVQILDKEGFCMDSIREAMGSAFPGELDLGRPQACAAGVDYRKLSKIRITQSPEWAQRIETEKAQIYLVKDFMSGWECDQIIKIIDANLRPSTISGDSSDRQFRTSSTCDLSLIKNSIVAAIDQKISAALGINLTYSEGIQGQKYKVGQQFKPHTDYFDADQYAEHASVSGNRTWTFMVYLNETQKGGGTEFLNIGKTFFPEKGAAVVWNNLHSDGRPNPDTLHSGMTVEEGEKYVITKWFREKGTGPMF